MEFSYQFGAETVAVRVEPSVTGFAVTINGQTFDVVATQRAPGELAFTMNGARHLAFVAAEGPRRWVAFDSAPFVLTVPQPEKRTRRARGGGHDALEAQMPGVVRKLMVAEGERVDAGQVLLVLEAMKMEIRVSAPGAGRVEKILVHEGETVGRGQTLIELRATDSPAG